MSPPSFSEFKATVLSLPIYVAALAFALTTINAENARWLNFSICVLTFYVCVLSTLLIHATAKKESKEEGFDE